MSVFDSTWVQAYSKQVKALSLAIRRITVPVLQVPTSVHFSVSRSCLSEEMEDFLLEKFTLFEPPDDAGIKSFSEYASDNCIRVVYQSRNQCLQDST